MCSHRLLSFLIAAGAAVLAAGPTAPGRPNDHGWRRAAQIEQDRERAWREYGHREWVRRNAVHGDDPA
jgi:hypothetical protein